MFMGKIPLGSTSCFGACGWEAWKSAGVISVPEEDRGHQHPHPALHSTQQSSQTSSARPSGVDIVSAHQCPPRMAERAELSHLARRQNIIPGCGRGRFKRLRGYVYPVQHKHTSLGSGMLRRSALSHFVEINIKFILSQIWVCLSHIRPTISAASALLQGPGGVGIHPSARVLGAAGESQGHAWGSAPMGPAAWGPPQPRKPEGWVPGCRAGARGATASVCFCRSGLMRTAASRWF